MSILEEIPFLTGSVKSSSSIAYVEHEPIIFSGLIKDLITFGKKYEREKIKEKKERKKKKNEKKRRTKKRREGERRERRENNKQQQQ